VSILKIRKKIKIDTQSILKKKKKFFYFKLSFSKFARDSQNTQTQTQNSNTQKIKLKPVSIFECICMFTS